MILTGPEIKAQIKLGIDHDSSMEHIHVDPYDAELVGPNSIDLRLGNDLLVYEEFSKFITNSKWLRYLPKKWSENKPNPLDMKKLNPTIRLPIPDDGIVLHPGILYLGTTIECIGSNAFVPIVEGRSSIGRLGVHVHVTAGFCDLGFKGQITLEIHVIHPIRVYSNTPICQAYFLTPRGDIELYKGRYQNQQGPIPSRLSLLKGQF